ncbi:oocyte zinc finger protein XlCOF7.1-like [Pseudophryne corroboree]|uniref:oocyte zinc finger protein XlCOF7.1-like n=1 Tax=Pseudophryne corroboree TaxID=495146 RepID=UPI0030819199
MDKDHTTERILNITLEIIYLLTREVYTVVKKSGDGVTPCSCPNVSNGLSRTLNPIMEFSPHSQIHERDNDQKVLKLTNKIIQLLTGEVPIRCEDVTVYLSMEEWEYLEGHKDLYKDVMMENHQPASSKDMPSSIKTSVALDLQMLSPDSIGEDESLIAFNPKAETNTVNKVAPESTSCDKPLQVTNTSTKYTQTEPTPTEEKSPFIGETANITSSPTDSTVRRYIPETSKSSEEGSHTGSDFYRLTEQKQNASAQPGHEMDSSDKGHLTDNIIYTPERPKSADITDESNSWDADLTYPKSLSPTDQTEAQYTSTCIIEVATLCDKGKVTCTDTYTPAERRQKSYTIAETSEVPTSTGKNVMYTNIYTPTELTQADLTNIKKELVSWEDGNLELKNLYIPPKNVQRKIVPSADICGTTPWDRSLTDKDSYPKIPFTTTRIKTEWEEGNFADIYAPPDLTQAAYATISIEDYNKDPSNIDKINKNLSIINCTSYNENYNSRLTYATPQIIQMYNCPLCNKCFSSSSNLAKHRLICKGRKPHICSGCGKCFASASYLVIHERIHTGEKPYSCSHCGKSFTRKPDLIRHERIHTGEKPFACPECGKCFTSVSNIFMHRRIHSGEKPFPCSECGKRFIKKSDLVRHEKIHMPQKPLPCPECGKYFGSKAILNKHMQVHAGEKTVTVCEAS